MSFTVSKWIEIDAGHRVPFHESKCRFLHGHRYRITATVFAPEVVPEDTGRSDSGMVVDFSVIKRYLTEEIGYPYDHQLLLWEKDPLIQAGLERILDGTTGRPTGLRLLPIIPTAEELARYWGELLHARFRTTDPTDHGTGHMELVAVEVHETPTSSAVWQPAPRVHTVQTLTGLPPVPPVSDGWYT